MSNTPLTVTLATATPGGGPYCPANWLRKLHWGEEAGGEQVVLARLVDDTKKLEFLGFAVGKGAIELQLLKRSLVTHRATGSRASRMTSNVMFSGADTHLLQLKLDIFAPETDIDFSLDVLPFL